MELLCSRQELESGPCPRGCIHACDGSSGLGRRDSEGMSSRERWRAISAPGGRTSCEEHYSTVSHPLATF